MQRPHVRLTLPDGSVRELEHGDLIGRLWSAALVIDDPRISEAHALVSLREGGFWLLSLRRKIAVGGRPVSEVRLEPASRSSWRTACACGSTRSRCPPRS
jgi:pSer/pThr/pTyr-binding forkhead associated (FHA) protein